MLTLYFAPHFVNTLRYINIVTLVIYHCKIALNYKTSQILQLSMRIKNVVYCYYSNSVNTVIYVALLLMLLRLLGYLWVAAALANHRQGICYSNQLAVLLFGIFLQQRSRRKVPVFQIQVLYLSVFFFVS